MASAQTTATAFVLHSRPYQDSSLLVDLLTVELGLIRVVAKGARNKSKKNSLRCDPYTKLHVNLSGRSNLKTLCGSEVLLASYSLQGERLFASMYVNELILRVLHEGDPLPEIVPLYETVIAKLAGTENLELILRPFELQLLDILGYGIDFGADVDGNEILLDKKYTYIPEHGFQLISDIQQVKISFTGQQINGVKQGDLDDEQSRRDAKILLRLALSPLAGNKPFMSRELFAGVQVK
jgi:DNA repair protein RecO (recombination protein O)|tara:strand:+ start:13964 stop:14677 length:714 start_codon:yes stop_codon:yes gene_type:complete